MKELSLNILDISENSATAGATLIEIELTEDDSELNVSVTDNGCGMSKEVIASVENPFYTQRTTRKVGLGIPLFKMAAEQTGGTLKIESKTKEEHPDSHGTKISASFIKNHIDFTPIGDIVSTITTLIQGHPDIDFLFTHKKNGVKVSLDTRELKEILEDVPLDSFEVLGWIKNNLDGQYGELYSE